MESRWSDEEARRYVARYADAPGCNEDVALRVYTSRLIGQDPSLVLHGGGNTSVKTQLRDDTGALVNVLCVKGSGWDLGHIEPAGLPAVRLDSLQALRKLDALSDEAMVNAQRIRLLDASAPNPSVETLLHAFIPHKYIDHSHADAILALADQADAELLAQEVFKGSLAVVPYVMPGFRLAKLAAEVQASHPEAVGLLLVQHGLFTFGESARESYERHVQAVDAAEQFIHRRRWWSSSSPLRAERVQDVEYLDFAALLRGKLSQGGRRCVLTLRQSDVIRGLVDNPYLADIAQRGVVTPDHVIRTKNLPLILDVAAHASGEALASHIDARLAAYRRAYQAYVQRQITEKHAQVQPLDPDPRIILVPGLGVIAAGATRKAAEVAADLYEHTAAIIQNAEMIGRYRALPEGDIFDMEYWSLEQAKLGKKRPAAFEGQVVLITGAARGIGAATARAFAAEGAHLYLVDRDAEALAAIRQKLGAPGEALDVTDAHAVRECLARAVRAYGGIDGIVSNAGVAPQGRMDLCDEEALRRSFEINFFAHQTLAAAAVAVLRQQGCGGFLLFNTSKSAFNPGPDFGPYTLPKAALVALMKQYAVEHGAAGIRTGAVNADRVRTQLLDPEDVAARARARGLDADAYYRSNLLGQEVLAEDVAAAFVWLAKARSTTGCVVAVDGGNIAASPR